MAVRIMELERQLTESKKEVETIRRDTSQMDGLMAHVAEIEESVRTIKGFEEFTIESKDQLIAFKKHLDVRTNVKWDEIGLTNIDHSAWAGRLLLFRRDTVFTEQYATYQMPVMESSDPCRLDNSGSYKIPIGDSTPPWICIRVIFASEETHTVTGGMFFFFLPIVFGLVRCLNKKKKKYKNRIGVA